VSTYFAPVGTCEEATTHDYANPHGERGDCENWLPVTMAEDALRFVANENERLRKALRKIARMTAKQIAENPWDVAPIARKALRPQ
jgi:hypothetical protein